MSTYFFWEREREKQCQFKRRGRNEFRYFKYRNLSPQTYQGLQSWHLSAFWCHHMLCYAWCFYSTSRWQVLNNSTPRARDWVDDKSARDFWTAVFQAAIELSWRILPVSLRIFWRGGGKMTHPGERESRKLKTDKDIPEENLAGSDGK